MSFSPTRFIFVALFSCFLFSCSKQKEESPKIISPPTVKDTLAKKKNRINGNNRTDTSNKTYKSYLLTGAKSLSDLSKEIGEKKMGIVFKINRRDLAHLKQGETIIIPNAGDDEMAYSPYPSHISGLDSEKKFLFVSRKMQAFAAYENGKLVKWGPTSTGKKATPTPAKLFYTNWKSQETHSTVDGTWILKWYFNLDNADGISLHEYELPGYPASHSCVRLLSEDAQWIYHWAEQWKLSADLKTVAKNGTPVLVFGDYSYGKNPPWKKLAYDAHSTDLTEEELNAAIKKYMPGQTKVIAGEK